MGLGTVRGWARCGEERRVFRAAREGTGREGQVSIACTTYYLPPSLCDTTLYSMLTGADAEAETLNLSPAVSRRLLSAC